jgi:hypothetical protein
MQVLDEAHMHKEFIQRTIVFHELMFRFKKVLDGFQNLKMEQEQTNQLEFSMRNLLLVLKSTGNSILWEKYTNEFNKLLVESERLILFDKNNYDWRIMMKRLNESLDVRRQNLYDLKQRIEYPKCKLKVE